MIKLDMKCKNLSFAYNYNNWNHNQNILNLLKMFFLSRCLDTIKIINKIIISKYNLFILLLRNHVKLLSLYIQCNYLHYLNILNMSYRIFYIFILSHKIQWGIHLYKYSSKDKNKNILNFF
jgi:hypothetical protein